MDYCGIFIHKNPAYNRVLSLAIWFWPILRTLAGYLSQVSKIHFGRGFLGRGRGLKQLAGGEFLWMWSEKSGGVGGRPAGCTCTQIFSWHLFTFGLDISAGGEITCKYKYSTHFVLQQKYSYTLFSELINTAAGLKLSNGKITIKCKKYRVQPLKNKLVLKTSTFLIDSK